MTGATLLERESEITAFTARRVEWGEPISGEGARPLPERRPVVTAHVVSPQASDVIHAVVSRIDELLALPGNWDSYEAQPISIAGAISAVGWFDAIACPGLPVPAVVPGFDGSIQFEWHTRGIDLEVSFPPYGAPEFAFSDHKEGREKEGLLFAEPDYGRSFVRTIASRTSR